MPKVDASLSDLKSMIGVDVSIEELEELLMLAKTELDRVDDDSITLDFKDTNRPDLWSVEGASRQIKYWLNPSGLVIPKIHDSGFRVRIHEEMGEVRPYTIAAVVKGIEFTEASLSQLIQLQEKLSQSYGRKRREIAIGVYNTDAIKWPVEFRLAKDEKFVPLGMDREMSPEEILKEHPKGQEFGHLLSGRYPVFVDASGRVLSMPPIINSEYSGRVDLETRNVFIEASGFNLDKAMNAVRIIAHALYDRGGQIHAVEMDYPEFSTRIDFSPRVFEADIDVISEFSGLGLDDNLVEELLRKYGYVVERHGRMLRLLYPSYREDIMHWRDVAEDLLISYGYNRIVPEVPRIYTRGGRLEMTSFEDSIREMLIGFGLQEVMTFVLSNPEKELAMLNLDGEVVEIANPVSSLYSCLRQRLLPGLLEFESRNQHVTYPHLIFETGEVVEFGDSETSTLTRKKLAVLVSHDGAGYGEISGMLSSLFEQLKLELELMPEEHPFFIPGRSASVAAKGRKIGFVGELAPDVLHNFGIEMPVAAFELYMDELMDLSQK